MGGKKKGLASKFAKMSDDERAKYLQLKADQEEEVRRRKEQLLTTFMKIKIKKEDAFSRLNKAKINLQWHHFLRVRKCREMKENCENLRRWIERVVTLKNRIIDNLMKELDESEFQYSNNLQAHLGYVDEVIEFYDNYVGQVNKEYEVDKKLTLDEALEERSIVQQRAKSEHKHLKAILYGQEIEGEASIKENHDYYLKKEEEYIKECKSEFDHLRKSHEATSGGIWKNIAATVRSYIEQTDKRRAQLAELRRLDAVSANEISFNQERIYLEEVQIQKYREEYTTLAYERSNTIKGLEEILKTMNKQALKLKQNLQKDLELDDKQLRLLGEYSRNATDHLEKILQRGEHLLQLSQCCRRHETQKEKVLRFFQENVDERKFVSASETIEDDSRDIEEEIMKITTETKEEFRDLFKGSSEPSSDESPKRGEIYRTQKYKILIRHKYRIKTAPKLKISEKLREELDKMSFPPECSKRREKQKRLSQSSKESGKGGKFQSTIVDDCITSLLQLDGMWNLCSKAKVDCEELRKEKSSLLEENIQLKVMLKGILEEAVLDSRPVIRKEFKLERYTSAPACYA